MEDKPSQKWVSDITYIPTGEGWLYLTTVLDLADRKVIGWALSDGLKAADTSIAAWHMALKNRNIEGKLLFHSDRGVQYACTEFRDRLRGLPVVQSMTGPPGGRKGNCWDNAIAESFFKTSKSELVNHTDFPTRAAARLATFAYIEDCRTDGAVQSSSEPFKLELPNSCSTGILFLHLSDGCLKNISSILLQVQMRI